MLPRDSYTCTTPVFGAVVPLGALINRALTPTCMQIFGAGGRRSLDDSGIRLSRNLPSIDLCMNFGEPMCAEGCGNGVRSHTPCLRCKVGVWMYVGVKPGAYDMSSVERDKESAGYSGNWVNLDPQQPPCDVTSWAACVCHMDEWGASSGVWCVVHPRPTTVALTRKTQPPTAARCVTER